MVDLEAWGGDLLGVNAGQSDFGHEGSEVEGGSEDTQRVNE